MEEERAFTTPQIDKRRYRRIALVSEVRCAALERDEILVTRDVSVGGAFITASKPLPAGADVTLALRLSSGGPLLTCHGKVVSSLLGRGMAVEFTGLAADAAAALQKFVDESQ